MKSIENPCPRCMKKMDDVPEPSQTFPGVIICGRCVREEHHVEYALKYLPKKIQREVKFLKNIIRNHLK